MEFGIVAVLVLGVVTAAEEPTGRLFVNPINTLEINKGLGDSELVVAFVVFRHGDRTPDLDELEYYPMDKISKDVFFPNGPKALTNKGKQRSYLIGEYLRDRFDGLISRLYLPDEITVRTTDYARTKMTALTALAAMYPPGQGAQRWNPALDWQPVPYDTLPFDQDDLLYYYNCPRYLWLRRKAYDEPQVKEALNAYEDLFTYLTQNTGTNITTPEDVFYLDNLFQALGNSGIETPKWALGVMPQIKEMTKIEYQLEFYNKELIKFATGVTMSGIMTVMRSVMHGDDSRPKLYLVSGHENNVAAWMAAAKVFYPHQPKYGATFSLELRRWPKTGEYGVTAVYSAEAGGPGELLSIEGCGGKIMCDFNTFTKLTQDVLLTYNEYLSQCPNVKS